ncbi:M23 family metallopeptidase [bacterium]|nr:M23 family metallopeptidase [bacterium]
MPGNSGISSVFGEFRPDHFHAGIDLRSPAGSGMEVFAPDSGYVAKVEINPWGYGKMLYLVTFEGNMAVYVHLSKFYDELERQVREEQKNRRSYSISIEFEENRFMLKKGQLVGYTGDTGTRIAHLHFEWREGYDRVVNPLDAGFFIEDSKRPEIFNLAVIPMSDETIIDGKLLPQMYEVEAESDSSYELEKPVFVWGKIGFALSASDRQSEENQNRFGIYAYDLLLNDSIIYSARYDSFELSHTDQIDLVWNRELQKLHGKRFHNLFVPSSSGLPFWGRFSPGSGILDISDLSKDTSTVAFYCSDIYGHSVKLQCRIVRVIPGELNLNCEERNSTINCYLEPMDAADNSMIRWWKSLDGKYWKSFLPTVQPGKGYYIDFPETSTVKLIRLSNVEEKYPFPIYWCALHPEYYFKNFPEPQISWRLIDGMFYVDIVFSNFIQSNPFGWLRYLDEEDHILCEHSAIIVAHSSRKYATRLKPNTKGSKISLTVGWTNPSGISQQVENICQYYRLTPGSGNSITSYDGELVLEDPSSAVFKETFVTLTRVDSLQDSLSYSSCWSVSPEELLVRNGVKLWLKVTEPCSSSMINTLCLAKYENDEWWFAGSEHDSASGYIGGVIKKFGTYSLRKDNEPPLIQPLIEDNSVFSYSPVSLGAAVADNLAGFSLQNLPEIFLDDEWVIGEYHPNKENVTYFPMDRVEKGEHVLVFQAKDNLGNASVDSVRFRVIK